MQEEKLYPWRWAILIGMMVLLISLQFAFIIPGGRRFSSCRRINASRCGSR